MCIEKFEIIERLDFRSLFLELLNTPIKGREWANVKCPFHSDQSPSLSINLRHGGFKCHAASCGESGDFFDLYMRLRDVSFREALEELSERI